MGNQTGSVDLDSSTLVRHIISSVLAAPPGFPPLLGQDFLSPHWPTATAQLGLANSNLLCTDVFLPLHGLFNSTYGPTPIQSRCDPEPKCFFSHLDHGPID